MKNTKSGIFYIAIMLVGMFSIGLIIYHIGIKPSVDEYNDKMAAQGKDHTEDTIMNGTYDNGGDRRNVISLRGKAKQR